MSPPEFPDRSRPRCPDWPDRKERARPRGRGTLTVEQISAVQRVAEERDIAVRDLEAVRRWALERANRIELWLPSFRDPDRGHLHDALQQLADECRALAGRIEQTHG